jgi:hypothetical protein
MRTTVVSIIVISLLVALAFSPMICVESQGQAPAKIVKISDTGMDVNEDYLYEFLAINFTLNVTNAGKYIVSGTLQYGLIKVTQNSTTKDLGTGVQTILLMFPSVPIFKSGMDGQFNVSYYLRYNGISFNNSDGNYLTSAYNHKEFNDPSNFPVTPPGFDPKVYREPALGRFVLKNDVMTVWFYYGTKRLVWFYTKDNRSMTKYYCEFIALDGYADRTGRFEPINAQYHGQFGEGTLTAATSSNGTSKIYGKFVTASITISEVPIWDSQRIKILQLANVTMTVMLTAVDRTINYQANQYYTIHGGTQVSVNFGIDLQSSLAMNGLAIEQDLWSESNKSYYHDFKLENYNYTQITRGSKDSNTYPYIPGSTEPQIIDFLAKNTQEHKVEGYYYWVNRARVDGVSSYDIAYYKYIPNEKHLRLYLTVTTGGTSITSVQTDPLGIGIYEDGCPCVQHYVKPKPPEQPNFLITILGWVTAIILVILPLYMDFRRSQKRLHELEEEFGEDL